MKRTAVKLVFVALALVAVLTFCSALAQAATSPSPAAVAKLAYEREAPLVAAEHGKLNTVRCIRSSRTYTYVCNFSGIVQGNVKICAATYVHDKPGNTGRYKVNIWGQSWPCGSRPPIAPPAYPGDAGPSS